MECPSLCPAQQSIAAVLCCGFLACCLNDCIRVHVVGANPVVELSVLVLKHLVNFCFSTYEQHLQTKLPLCNCTSQDQASLNSSPENVLGVPGSVQDICQRGNQAVMRAVAPISELHFSYLACRLERRAMMQNYQNGLSHASDSSDK